MADKDDEAPGGQEPGAQPKRDQRDIPSADSNSQPGSLPPDPFGFDYAEDWKGDISASELSPGEDHYRSQAYEAVAHLAGDYGLLCFPIWWLASENACACKDGISCDSKGKHPIDLAWPSIATANPEQAARWWRPLSPGEELTDWRPRANIGIMMGERHFLLDVDMGEDQQGDISLTALISHYGQDMPHTLLYQTGGGGRQHVMLAPEGVEVRNSVSELGDNLDVRGHHGYGIVPPSRSGKGPYLKVVDAPPAKPPGWIVEWLTEQQRKREERIQSLPKGDKDRPLPDKMSARAQGYIDAALADAIKRVSEAPDGERNKLLNAQAFDMFAKYAVVGLLDPGDVMAALKDAAGACNLPDAEARRTLRSAWEGAQAKPRSGELPDFIFDEPAASPERQPSITSMVYSFERYYSLRRADTGEFISRPNALELPALTIDIGAELGHRLRLWWRKQAEAWNQHLREKAAATQSDPDDKKDDEDAYAAIFPVDATFSNTLSHLQASATQHRPVAQHTRCFDDKARHQLIIDLANDEGKVVVIDKDGFYITDPRQVDGQPWFRRDNTMGSQVTPAEPGDVYAILEEARLVLGVTEAQWRVILGGLIGAHFPLADRPGWWLTGPSGAGKTTRGRMIAGWIDPSKHLGGPINLKRDDREGRTRAMHRFVVSIDNITAVSQDLSDYWCRLHTGVSEAARKLHSDNILLSYEYKRVGLATSLTLPIGLKDDALRRLLHVELQASDYHPDSSKLWYLYEAIKPQVLASLYQVISAVLARQANGGIEELPGSPEMSEYAGILFAADQAYPDLGGLFRSYCEHAAKVLEARGADNPLVATLKRWVTSLPECKFEGTPTDFYRQFELFASEATAEKWWPGGVSSMGHRLVESNGPLEQSGVSYRSGWGADGKRKVTVRLMEAEIVGGWPVEEPS